MAVSGAIQEALSWHSQDQVMLDAFWQWATNPTSMSAGYALEENYEYVKQNLARRYGLSDGQANSKVEHLKQECDALMANVNASDLREAIKIAIEGNLGNVLRREIGRRVDEAALGTRCTIALLNWLRANGFHEWQLPMLLQPPGTKLQALLRATLGALSGEDVRSFQGVLDELLVCGVLNLMFYRSTKGGMRDEYVFGPLLPDLDLHATVPADAVPTVEAHLDTLFGQQHVEQARLLEEIATEGVLDIGDRQLPQELASSKGVVGAAEGYDRYTRAKEVVAAVNPLIRDQVLHRLVALKQSIVAGLADRIEEALMALRNESWPNAEFMTLMERADRGVWRFDVVGQPRLIVYLGNWITKRDLANLRELGGQAEDSFVFFLSSQTVPSIQHVLFGTLKWWQRPSLTVVTVASDNYSVKQVQGEQHESIPRLVELIRGKGTIPEDIPLQLTLRTGVTPSVGQEITIKGEVMDQKGNPVPQAQVVLSWGDDADDTSVTTETRGVYSAMHIYNSVGEYKITASADKPGFVPGSAMQEVTVTQSESWPRQAWDIIVGDDKDTDTGLLGWSPDGESVGLDMFAGLYENSERAHAISIFGVPESGKSYTLGVILEMALSPQPGVRRGKPLPAVVFHYDQNVAYKPEFAKMAAPTPVSTDIEDLRTSGISPKGVDDVTVLVPPWRVSERERDFPDANVRGLTFSPRDLGVEQWLLFMGVPGSAALYIDQIRQLLLGLDVAGELSLSAIREAVGEASMSDSSKKLAMQRLELASQWVSEEGAELGSWLKPGRLVVLDIRDPMIDVKDAMRLCLISVGLLQTVQGDNREPMPKLIVLDEAHKYLHKDFAKEMETIVNQRRHTATTVAIASQNPDSIPPDVLEKSSVVALHKLTSGKQINHVKKAVEGLSQISNSDVTKLKKGQAIMWSTASTDPRVTDAGLNVSVRKRYSRHV